MVDIKDENIPVFENGKNDPDQVFNLELSLQDQIKQLMIAVCLLKTVIEALLEQATIVKVVPMPNDNDNPDAPVIKMEL